MLISRVNQGLLSLSTIALLPGGCFAPTVLAMPLVYYYYVKTSTIKTADNKTFSGSMVENLDVIYYKYEAKNLEIIFPWNY